MNELFKLNNIKKKSPETSSEVNSAPYKIISKLLKEPRLRKIAFASLAVLGLSGSFQSKAQNLDQTKIKNQTEESIKKVFDNNYVIKPDLKRWIHWIKTEDYISPDKEKNIEKIKDVSEEEMRKVYEYLESIMNVWDYKTLDEFRSKLYYAEEGISKNQSLKDKEIISVESTKFSEFLKPDFNGEVSEDVKKILEQDAINLAKEIERVLNQ